MLNKRCDLQCVVVVMKGAAYWPAVSVQCVIIFLIVQICAFWYIKMHEFYIDFTSLQDAAVGYFTIMFLC